MAPIATIDFCNLLEKLLSEHHEFDLSLFKSF